MFVHLRSWCKEKSDEQASDWTRYAKNVKWSPYRILLKCQLQPVVGQNVILYSNLSNLLMFPLVAVELWTCWTFKRKKKKRENTKYYFTCCWQLRTLLITVFLHWCRTDTTHTHTHTHTHVHMCADTCACMHMQTHMHTQHTHTHIHIFIPTYMYSINLITKQVMSKLLVSRWILISCLSFLISSRAGF